MMKRTYVVLSNFNAIKKLVNTLIPQCVTHTPNIHILLYPHESCVGRNHSIERYKYLIVFGKKK